MAGLDEEDYFSDDVDVLNGLGNDYLTELENNAIQFTQAQARTKVAPSSDYGDGIDDEDFDDAVVIDESRSIPAITSALQRNVPGQSSERGHFRQFRQQHDGLGTISNPRAQLADRQLANIPPAPQFDHSRQIPNRVVVAQHDSMLAEQGSQPSFPDEGIELMQKQIQELMRERDSLKRDLNAKSGEIAIVRSKQEKTVKQYEREMIALRKLNEDRISKQEKELEAAKIAERNAATEREFLRQEVAEESEKVRRLNRTKAKEKIGASVTTPKKKALPHRDGFDDDEIDAGSPSRTSPSKFRNRLLGSPSKPSGGKRKRKNFESPIAALEVHQADEQGPQREDSNEMILDEVLIDGLSRPDDRFDFLGTMLDHQIDFLHLRSIQELDKYSLPSASKESFQSVILGKIPMLGLKKSQKDLPVDFCELLISMWAKCMEEKYLAPIHIFIDMLTTALELKTTSIATAITDSIVPLIQLTADLVVIPRWKGHSAEQHEKYVDVSACLALLHITALGCMSEQDHIVRFWKLMRFDFVLVMLSPTHPTPDFEMMLRLLSTSVFKESFGAIVAEASQASQVMDNILDRLTYTLFDVPPLPHTSEKMAIDVLSKLRVKVLLLLTSMTRSPFASRAMAMHPHAIGRLVSLINDEVDDLYDYKARHEESSRTISLATRLLYFLITKFDAEIDIQKKLAVIRGGSQKYLLTLSRLNFSEDDLLLESGIDSDVASCALELLELVVTPEEGEAIHLAFSTNS
ncbi:hypothetical protein HYALB_00006959 [Hymenoscyphus albidus]|uniref:DNA repair protein Rad26 n=1 Tax=Hymenoscyphus albidus TaxID=595503 RepID=A0A9N9LJW5_9HELO|nr:hypothetical protein HYALB_00006959 [Hymenoscyphus albidus]